MGVILRVRRLCFLLAILFTLFTYSGASASLTLYVAPNGNDHWSGRLSMPNRTRTDGPLATFHGALTALRKERASGGIRGPVTVYFKGGTYAIGKPIVVTPADSGTTNSPVTFAAYLGETPIISGGRAIKGWKKGSDGVWSAKLPVSLKGWDFQQLFVNGKRRIRAHLPVKGFYRMVAPAPPITDPATHQYVTRDRTAFIYHGQDFERWPDISDAQVVVYHSWETSRLRIKSLDEENHIVTFTGSSNWPFGTWERDQRYTINNIREGLKLPGEWYLNERTGVVEYMPYHGENPNKENIIAPVTDTLMQFDGNPETGRLGYIRITGFHFEYSDWTLEPQGHSDGQAAVTVPAAIMAEGLYHFQLDHCDIAHIGTNAIWLNKGCRYDLIQHNIIRDMGVGGVKIGDQSRPSNPEDLSSYNRVDNNQIYDGGYVYPAGVGIWVAQSDHNTLSHNDIHDLNYDGISVGWNWGDEPNDTNNNLIEYNRIYRVMRGKLSDGGGIYCLGVSTGSVIKGNFIYDVFPYPNPPFAWGIYLDATTSGYTVEDNIVYDVFAGCLMGHNGAHDNTIENNIFADSATALIWPFVPDTHNIIRDNICYVKQGSLFLSWSTPALRNDFDDNLYSAAKGATIDFWGHPLSFWQAQGEDQHSLIADPMFVDANRYDFRLRKDSPALKLGFHPIEMEKIGLYGEKAWVNSAKKFHSMPGKLPPPPPPPKPLTFRDGFEHTAAGALPKLGQVIGERGGASIRVTDKLACVGKHCLEFKCEPGMAHPWEPLLQYAPNTTKGVAELDFDIRMEPGAIAFVEWRDSANPYLVGPSLQIRDGDLYANGSKLMRIDNEVWYHIHMRCPLGDLSNGHYDMTVSTSGATAREFPSLPDGSPKFQSLEWLGFVCLADNHAIFYVDDLSLQLKSR